jgi:hypothetical protein
MEAATMPKTARSTAPVTPNFVLGRALLSDAFERKQRAAGLAQFYADSKKHK